MSTDNQTALANVELPTELKDRRMLSTEQAAALAGLSAKHFKRITPVKAVRVGTRKLGWPSGEVVRWLDGCRKATEAA
jgi:predicted DNA-binding transcriptional regulator AlpA